jgi:glycosyltransferase involved in cell wall biosynthesis
MKILFISNVLTFGGACESQLILIKGLLKLEHSVQVVTNKIDEQDAVLQLTSLGVPVTVIDCGQFHSYQATYTPIYRLPFEFAKYYKNKSRLLRYIQENEIDIVHINSTVLAHLLKPIKKSAFVKKVFIHVRELLSAKYDPYFIGTTIINQIHRWADHVVCISENELTCLKKSNNISVVYNPMAGVTEELTNLNAENTQKKFRVLMYGKFHPSKGQIDFLRGVRLFIDISPDISSQCTFVILGIKKHAKVGLKSWLKSALTQDYEEQFYAVLHKLELNKLVELIPFKKDVSSELKMASVVVRSSISGDPWGRDIIESMSHGKAIIATGTYSGFVRPGFNGELVTPGKPIEIAEALKKIIPSKIESYGHNSFVLAKQLFDEDAHVIKINELYKNG